MTDMVIKYTLDQFTSKPVYMDKATNRLAGYIVPD